MNFDADVQKYKAASSSEAIFFDRGIIDALGMLAESAVLPPTKIEENLRHYPYIKTVFLLPPWQAIYHPDNERDQTFTEAVQVFERILSWYRPCGYELREVPIGSVYERVHFVLTAVENVLRAG